MRNFERYCKDYENIENYEKAKADDFKNWEVHHRLETHTSDGERRAVDITADELKALGIYYNRPASELIFLRKGEHSSLRKLSSEAKKKLSEATKGKKYALGCKRSEETRKKIGAASKGNKHALGYHHSEEAKKKLSDVNKGKKLSEETKKKMSEARKGKSSGMKGKHHSEEAKKKLGAATRETRWYNNGKINIRAKMCPKGFVPGRIPWKK